MTDSIYKYIVPAVIFIPPAMLPKAAAYIYFVCIGTLISFVMCIGFCIKDRGRTQELQSITRRNSWSVREPYRPNLRVNMSFNTISEITRLAMRALPPVKNFGGEDMQCPICLEELKAGELVQPFVVCAHEFHTSCLNSWLRGGGTTCPVCRHDLLSNH
ncbi:RING-H2 finger protein ATL22 [Trifolium pratense]|uniref:RING-H2 finger protein ATL22 n=1 Tax=Trifolium pratense TaxID=57577 RepID=A0A2K3PHP2_TRIPR|nr:RING-H2 finger protein ATL22 [Trifolium pratense]